METLLFLGQDLLLLLPYLTYQLQKLQILPLIRKTIYRPTHVEHFVIFGARFVVFVVPFFPFFLSSLYRIYSYIPTLSLKNNNNNNNNNNTHYFLRPLVSIIIYKFKKEIGYKYVVGHCSIDLMKPF